MMRLSFYFLGLFVSFLLLSVTESKELTVMPPEYDRQTDSLALIALRKSFSRSCDTSKIWGWNLNTSIISWPGVTLNQERRVVRIDLSNSCLYGEIPKEIGELSQLISLDLSSNRLEGTIPPEIGNLIQLTSLNLSNNIFLVMNSTFMHERIRIPPEIGNLIQLISLDLSGNQHIGEIPPAIGNLTKLRFLDLEGNLLSQSIPSEIGNLIQLTILNLSDNQLEGEIPLELGSLINLTTLNLSNNQLEGTIPSEIGNLSQLNFLDLSSNLLAGAIPPEIGNLIQLTSLNLSDNGETPFLLFGGVVFRGISGEIPVELWNLTNLTNLDLSHNQLRGIIPSEIGNLTQLISLNLSDNGIIPVSSGEVITFYGLSGEFPLELWKLTHLSTLNLGGNKFSGTIPSEIENLNQLTHLNLSRSDQIYGGESISGKIPIELGTLSQLTILDLSNNELDSNIPSELGNLTKLTTLNLSNNQLKDSIPTDLGKLNQLITLDLSNNQLSKEIPSSISNLEQINFINLESNNLMGELPSGLKDLEASINLRNNRLSKISDMRSGKIQIESIKNNHFTFDDIIPNLFIIESTSNYTQRNFIHKLSYILGPCDEPIIDLAIDKDIADNEYTWYKDGVQFHISNQNKLNLRNVFSTFEEYGGIYTVKVTNPNVPTSLTLQSNEIVVELDEEFPIPETISIEKSICLGTSFDTLNHSFNCSAPESLISIPDSISGCITMYNIQLNCTDCREISGFPTAITPNGDGKNEFFIIPQLYEQLTLFPNNELFIYDTNGQIQYQQQDYKNDWRGKDNLGKDLPIGTYFYVFKYDGRKPFSGKITIIR